MKYYNLGFEDAKEFKPACNKALSDALATVVNVAVPDAVVTNKAREKYAIMMSEMRDAGGCHQEIDRTEVLFGLGDHTVHPGRIADIGLIDPAFPAERLDLALCRLSRVPPTDVVERDVGSGLGKLQAHSPPDAPAAAGDQGDSTCKFR